MNTYGNLAPKGTFGKLFRSKGPAVTPAQQAIAGTTTPRQPNLIDMMSRGATNNAPLSPSTPAAQRSDLQGAGYFKNLQQSGTPAEQKAASGWLGRHPIEQYGAGNKDVKSVTTDPKTGKTTVGLYSDQKTGLLGAKPTTPPAAPAAPTTPPAAQIGTPTPPPATAGKTGQERADAVIQASQPNAMATGAANASALYGTLGNVAGLQGYAGRNDGLLNSFSNLSRATTEGQLSGASGLFNTKNAIFQNAANTAAGQALAQQQLQTQGATSVLGAGQNQQAEYGKQSFNPLTGQFEGKGGITTQTDINSIRSAKDWINTANQLSGAIDNGFSAAINYAKSANLDPNSGILSGIQHAISQGLVTSAALTGFTAAIESLNSQLASLGEAPIDAETATATSIAQAQQTIKANLARKKTGYEGFISGFDANGNPKGSTGGTTGTVVQTAYGAINPDL